MTNPQRPSPDEIRRARLEAPGLRARDFASGLGISEAEYVAAHVGTTGGPISARRIRPFGRELLGMMPGLGEVMVLTRNDSAVHETIGTFGNFSFEGSAAAVFGDNINLRLFFRHWAHGYAVARAAGDAVRHSVQIFDLAGDAVLKIHLRPGSNLEAYEALVRHLQSEDQLQQANVSPYLSPSEETVSVETCTARARLRERWDGLRDVHEFYPMLREMGISRHLALQCVGEERAWRVAPGSVRATIEQIAARRMPAMCFVGSRGCTQIYGGPILDVKEAGVWFNIMDERFHLHLHEQGLADVWAVRRPIAEGKLTSLEGYDAQKRLIIQLFGAREQTQDEPAEWRALVDSLPRLAACRAA